MYYANFVIAQLIGSLSGNEFHRDYLRIPITGNPVTSAGLDPASASDKVIYSL
jgi:hypothetical protein